MYPLSNVFENQVLVVALLAGLAAQSIKLVVALVQTGKINLRVLTTSGGMPSSHSALVVALATGVGQTSNWSSNEFAIAAVFAFIVMYDAAGVRRAAGKQARVLNIIIEELFSEKPQFLEERLMELLGHTPVQVFAGAALGFIFMWLVGPG
ncbi:divergent PAP2 family protein [Candidatus Cyanaurora vandensis]|uniref:divergent PAP2 family protein n=1 Tax=Candidatus Cyanaurora vandensis TaxID=2714958 RepID=UPI00257CA3BC|nr:divergent PAP2 family protein [Candidatus Cyanaurora vandensis]